ncbi:MULTISPECIES: C40 family peptidase [unclassified Paenibacillus]|uniref:C40 family peptidase n=1 Tax=unclassified Paenibacillus TaxID=185978 RepID=UPI00211846B8|nr:MULTISPECIES: C40 family peptidase [unclassified Paenibacillus]
MKDIKTRTRVKNIKKLDRFSNLMEKAKPVDVRSKHKSSNRHESESTGSSVVHAQNQSVRAAKTTLRNGMRISSGVSKGAIRLLRKKRERLIGTEKEKVTMPQQSGETSSGRRSGKQSGIQASKRSLVSDKQQALSAHSTGAIQGRDNRQAVHSFSKTKRPLQLNPMSKPVEKRVTTTNNLFKTTVRSRDKRSSLQPGEMTIGRKRNPAPVRSSAHKLVKPHAGVSGRVKTGGKVIKVLSHSVKPIHQSNQEKGQVHNPTDRMKHKAREAQKAAFRLMTTHRSKQRLRAVARWNIRMIRVAAKMTAVLAKGMIALLGVSGTVIILLCIMMAVAAVVSSPFGIFVSSDNTDSDVLPLSDIVQDMDNEFAVRLEDIRRDAGSVDRVEIHYLGSADNTRIDNWMDVIAVFAVRTVMDSENGMDVATLDATRVDVIRSVFWDMNQLDSYVETIEHRETITVEHEDGSTSKETITWYESVLHITVASHTAGQQADIYDFTIEQREIMHEMLSAEFRPLMFALLGKDMDVGLTTEQLEIVYHDLPKGEWGGEAVRLALTRLGDPYSQVLAGQDRYTDCSYLVQWVYRQLSIQLPRTAAEQARHCVDNGWTIRFEDLAPGDLVFWSYASNGRFMDITHVGIYAGNGKVVDASSTRGQVVYRNLFDADQQVLYGRPFQMNVQNVYS